GALPRGGHRPPTVAAERARGGTPRVLGRTGPARVTDHSRTPVPPAPAAPASPRSRAGGAPASPPARPPTPWAPIPGPPTSGPSTPGRRTDALPRAPGGVRARRQRKGGGNRPEHEPASCR